jgi:hypothetical protein
LAFSHLCVYFERMNSATLALIVSALSMTATVIGTFVIQRRNMLTAQRQLKTAQDQLEAARAHYRLSVKPFLVATRSILPDEEKATELALVTVCLLNTGVGPAIISSFTVYVDDKAVDSTDDQVWVNTLKLLSIETIGTNNYHHVVNKGFCINPKESITLLKVRIPGAIENLDLVKKSFVRSKMVVVYESFYKESWTYDTSGHKQKNELPASDKVS